MGILKKHFVQYCLSSFFFLIMSPLLQARPGGHPCTTYAGQRGKKAKCGRAEMRSTAPCVWQLMAVTQPLLPYVLLFVTSVTVCYSTCYYSVTAHSFGYSGVINASFLATVSLPLGLIYKLSFIGGMYWKYRVCAGIHTTGALWHPLGGLWCIPWEKEGLLRSSPGSIPLSHLHALAPYPFS